MSVLLEASGIAVPERIAPCDLRLESGTLTALIGPNGGGKTSLLRALARIAPARGLVWVDGEDLDAAPPPRRRQLLSFLPASRDVVWPISVHDLVALGLERPDPARVQQLIGLLDLQRLADRPADLLSTGERSRALLARALAPQPKVLLLDEPLSNLDPFWVLRVLTVLDETVERGCAALVALHDLSLLERFDRVILVGSGQLLCDGAPAAVLASEPFRQAFGVERAGDGWRISRSGDRRSSP